VTSVLTINKNLTITGPGSNLLTISGNHATQVLNIAAPIHFSIRIVVDLSGLTIANGNNPGGSGGGIYYFGVDGSLTDVIFSRNTASYGGGIVTITGSLALTNVTFTGNSATGGNGGGYGGGMLDESGRQTTLTNVTFSGNSAIGDFSLGGGFGSFSGGERL